jgi:signal transduction histidine kinase
MLGAVVDDLKNISRSLNPRFLEEIGLNEAIRLRMQQLQRSGKYKIDLGLEPLPRALNRQKQLILFYIFQEAINNISKHARARTIAVKIVYDPGKLEMYIKDDGLGINNPGPNKVREKGSGLINMKNHAGIMGARLEIRSEQNQGTEVFVSIPDPYT